MFGITPFEKRDYDLFDAFHSFENEFFSKNSFSAFRTDVKDMGDSYQLEAEMPGFEKEDITVDVDNGMLTIKAEHKTESEDKDEKGSYIRRERTYGSYARSFDVSNVKTDEIEASYKNGVLNITLPKKNTETPPSRRLEIK